MKIFHKDEVKEVGERGGEGGEGGSVPCSILIMTFVDWIGLENGCGIVLICTRGNIVGMQMLRVFCHDRKRNL